MQDAEGKQLHRGDDYKMSKTVSLLVAIAGFYLFPNLLIGDLAKNHTIGLTVYVIYIVAILCFAYYVRKHTQDEMRQIYRQAEKAAEKAVFHEKMKAYSETEEKI